MVAINDSKSRTNPVKLPMTQPFNSNQAKGKQPLQNYTQNGQSRTEKNSRNGG